jgi:hypothetical protein
VLQKQNFWKTTTQVNPCGKMTNLLSALTPSGKATNLLSSLFSLKMAERSEDKSAKRRFASKIKNLKHFASRC